jgi:hypothetical protein
VSVLPQGRAGRNVQATYRCALCGFDYVTLAHDSFAREGWMLENLQQGPMAALFLMHLHHLILAQPAQLSRQQVMAFADQHGIVLPKGEGLSGKRAVLYVLVALILFVGILSIVGLLTQ